MSEHGDSGSPSSTSAGRRRAGPGGIRACSHRRRRRGGLGVVLHAREEAEDEDRQERSMVHCTSPPSEHLLQIEDVDPASELVTQLREAPLLDEAEAAVDRDARLLIGGDAGDHRVVPERGGARQEVGEQRAPGAAPLLVVPDVERSPRPCGRTPGAGCRPRASPSRSPPHRRRRRPPGGRRRAP